MLCPLADNTAVAQQQGIACADHLGCSPLCDPAVSGDGDQALFLLQASVHPPHLPHWVAVLPAACTAAQTWYLLQCRILLIRLHLTHLHLTFNCMLSKR